MPSNTHGLEYPLERARKDLLYPLFCRKPKVRILLYTDSSLVQLDQSSNFGLQIMRDWILDANPFHATFEFVLLKFKKHCDVCGQKMVDTLERPTPTEPNKENQG